jgi:myo-inositol-1(or 4)-monophosphatase
LKYNQLLEKAFQEADKIINQSEAASSGFVEREIKLSTDVELDVFFRNYLEKNTLFPVYSEESLGEKKFLNEKCWIVDPLDGSLNFFRGIPFFASSIALWEEGKPLLGGVYDYTHKEFYYGEVGGNATLNGKLIQVGQAKLGTGIKATGVPSFSSVQESLKMFEKSLSDYKKLRWLGCASLSLAYVASGKMDAYEELGIKIWDVAGGMALVLAAGGQIETHFNPDGSLNLLALNRI